MIVAADHKYIYIKFMFLLNHHNQADNIFEKELKEILFRETLAVCNSLFHSTK